MQERIYLTFNYPNSKEGDKTLLTGIRKKCGKYYISGFYISGNTNTAFVYAGNLSGGINNGNSWNNLSYPSSIGSTVTSTELYGPNPLRDNYIRVVGNYTTTETGNKILGVLYEGKLDGSGTWTTLTPSIDTVNTIAHSTIGDLVVGNYETTILGRGFIYDIITKEYYEIIKPDITSITAYGIWQNDSKHCYTICGGYNSKPYGNSLDTSYLVSWNNKTHTLSNWRSYKYQNNPDAIITHFDGISGKEDEYTLTGDASVNGINAFLTKVKRCSNKKKILWEEIKYPISETTSGNSVWKDIVIGVYTKKNSASVNGYVSVVI